MNKLSTLVLGLAVVAAALSVGLAPRVSSVGNAAHADEPAGAPSDAAVKRTRNKVQMLDEIYKQAIVLITDKYVHDASDFPAGSAAVVLFANISKSGSHQVRLIDATGQPSEEANVAKDAFEREGIKALKAGAKTHEQIVQEDGKHQLRVLTPVPVVMKKCVMCHDHYADVKEGEPIGAISYIVPIE